MRHLAWPARDYRGVATPKRRRVRWSPVEGLHVEVDGATAGETDGERFVVGVAEGDDAALALTLEDLERGGDHRAFDAAAGHRARDLAVVAHRHGGARIARG